jgi:hypothetical protein
LATISQHLIDRYSAGPSPSKTSGVGRLQNAIREVLEPAYDTFLQGSYRNSTALADINDVDIVAREIGEKAPKSVAYWEALFEHIARLLRTSSRISGAVSIGDKCVKLTGSLGGLNADIVPALAIRNLATDPIAVWSRRRQVEVPNHPRVHYDNGVRKQADASDAYKPTVRLLKGWSRQYAGMDKTAPSFYLECAVHDAADSNFRAYLPRSLFNVGREILSWSRYKRINSVAGDKDILVTGEWSPDNFEAFKAKLKTDVAIVGRALTASSTAEADRLWKLAFGE